MKGQREIRETERGARLAAVKLCRWLGRRGHPAKSCAHRLGIPRQTLARWREGWEATRLESQPVGRTADRPEAWKRNMVIEVLALMGRAATEEVLKRMFPGIAVRELRELAWRWRAASRKRYGDVVASLRWRKPGRVWALDFTQAPVPVDGTYPYVLVARDLASGMTLSALPCESCDAETVIGALAALFLEHGPPLVVKWDNGSAFLAEETREFIEVRGVATLYSPPGLPSFNGSCEAGIGGLKTRAHHLSTRNDRPGEWTCEDVEGSRELGNETSRPRGRRGLYPIDAWSRRDPIPPEERAEFQRVLAEERRKAQAERGILLPYALSRREKDDIDRVAVTMALTRCELLLIRRRRIPKPFFDPNRPNVSA